MPLEKGAQPGSSGFGRNIATEEKAAKPQKQAVAIAYQTAKDADPHQLHSYMDSVRRGDSAAMAKHFQDRK